MSIVKNVGLGAAIIAVGFGIAALFGEQHSTHTVQESVLSSGMKQIDVTIKSDLALGGSTEWNTAALEAQSVYKPLLDRSDVAFVRLRFVGNSMGSMEWAQMTVSRDTLPPNWKDLTYLQVFARSDVLPGSLETAGWLCDFYDRYNSAIPPQGKPPVCRA